MNVHQQVLSSMHDAAEKFSRGAVKLLIPRASDGTLSPGTRTLTSERCSPPELSSIRNLANSMPIFQGGFLCAIFDGPLTCTATGRPVVTMITAFLRPFTERDASVIVRAEAVAQSRTLLVLKAEARNKK